MGSESRSWQLPAGREPGLIQHTVGWPADQRTYAGSFLYHLDQNRVYVGYVAGLDYEDPEFRPFEAFQQFKQHPGQRTLFEGGELLSRRAHDHRGRLAVTAARHAGRRADRRRGRARQRPEDQGRAPGDPLGRAGRRSPARKEHQRGVRAALARLGGGRELYKVRNMRPGFRGGLWVGLANAALETVTAGHTPWT